VSTNIITRRNIGLLNELKSKVCYTYTSTQKRAEMKYYYLSQDEETKFETTKEMFDSQVEYYATYEAFAELHGDNVHDVDDEPLYSDFAKKHVFEAPEGAVPVVCVDYTVI
jgi:uncharacterized protein YpmS